MNISHEFLLKDSRINGLSLSGTVSVKDYLSWYIEFGKDNKLDEQRPVLNTRSANAIRKRLVDDLCQGAIIPPIVLGLSLGDELKKVTNENVKQIVCDNIQSATVIDGMQRSDALCQAMDANPDISNNPLRLDIWLSPDTVSLIYRMLVLNTGQTPWDVKRQMEVVYKPLIKETREKVPDITIHEKNDAKRRTNGGEYQASAIVELFLAFSSRKEQVNTRETLSDDFTRLEVAQMAGEPNCSKHFFTAIQQLTKLDKAFAMYKGNAENASQDGYKEGLDVFTEMPSKVGFIVAIAQRVLGRAGTKEKPSEEQDAIMKTITDGIDSLVAKFNGFTEEQMAEFLLLDSLNEALARIPKKNIGNRQRAFFLSGFEALISENFNVDNLDVIWQAY